MFRLTPGWKLGSLETGSSSGPPSGSWSYWTAGDLAHTRDKITQRTQRINYFNYLGIILCKHVYSSVLWLVSATNYELLKMEGLTDSSSPQNRGWRWKGRVQFPEELQRYCLICLECSVLLLLWLEIQDTIGMGIPGLVTTCTSKKNIYNKIHRKG